MSKRLSFSLMFTLCFLICVGTVSALAPATVAPAAGAADAAAQEPPGRFVIRDFHGKIAVFESGSDSPVQITETLTSSLPSVDTIELKGGVYAADERELRRLLEDYCS